MVEQSFKEAMTSAGLHTSDPIIADGKLHRFRVEGDGPQSKNGWYVLYDDSLVAGAYGSWKTGQRYTFCVKSDHALTPAERENLNRRWQEARNAREQEEANRRQEAQRKALFIWKSSPSASDDHPYLATKGVRNHGLKLCTSGFYRGSLIVPLRDPTGTLWSIQYISENGVKHFLSGGRKKGLYFSIGRPVETIAICEGYATAASVYEATGHATACAFDAGNLETVAKILRQKFPSIELLLCADNDEQTTGNPGVTKARGAAAAVGALLAVPGGAHGL